MNMLRPGPMLHFHSKRIARLPLVSSHDSQARDALFQLVNEARSSFCLWVMTRWRPPKPKIGSPKEGSSADQHMIP